MSEKKTRTSTVNPSPSRGVHIPSEKTTYILIDQGKLDVLIGEYMELLDILPADQGIPLKKQIKKIAREWLDGYYDHQVLRRDCSSFYGYNFDNESFPNTTRAEACHIAGLDEVYILEPKQVPAFVDNQDVINRSKEISEKYPDIWNTRTVYDMQDLSDL